MDAHTADHIERHEIVSHEQWLEWRKQDVTASRVGALFSVHPYETAASLYWEKRGVEMPAVEETEAMERGQLIEAIADRLIKRERPDWQITKATHYWRDPAARLGATPDYYAVDERARQGVIQVKSVVPAAFEASWTETKAPDWIIIQLATEMHLSGAEWGAIACIVVNAYRYRLFFRVHLYEQIPHRAFEKNLRHVVAEFWDNVKAGVEPQINFERDSDLLTILYPHEVPGKFLDLRGDNRLPELLDQRETLTAEIKQREAEKKKIETEIKEKLTDCETALARGWELSFREQHRAGYEVKPTSFRVLRATRE